MQVSEKPNVLILKLTLCFAQIFVVSSRGTFNSNVREVWLIGRIVKPAECQYHWVSVATVEVVTVTSVSVSNANMIAELLDSEDRFVCIWAHVLPEIKAQLQAQLQAQF